MTLQAASRDMIDLADGEDPFIAYPRVVHLCSFHTCSGSVTVKGKEWPFDFSERFGPLWLRKDGESRANQNPPFAVWRAFDRWNRRRCATAGRD